MSGREFRPVIIRDRGEPRLAVRIVCAQCAAVKDLSPSWIGTGSCNVRVPKYLKARGWLVGRGPAEDLCPACNGGSGVAARVRKDRIMTQAAKLLPAKAQPPREPTREDRRLIILAIEEHWLDEQTGYAGDMTDEAIAGKLGVPPAWVTRERKELYGDVESNESVATLRSDLAALQRDVQALQMDNIRALEQAGTIRDRCADICSRLGAVEARAKKLPGARR